MAEVYFHGVVHPEVFREHISNALDELHKEHGHDPVVREFVKAGKRVAGMFSSSCPVSPVTFRKYIRDFIRAEKELVDKKPKVHAWFMTKLAERLGVETEELYSTVAEKARIQAKNLAGYAAKELREWKQAESAASKMMYTSLATTLGFGTLTGLYLLAFHMYPSLVTFKGLLGALIHAGATGATGKMVYDAYARRKLARERIRLIRGALKNMRKFEEEVVKLPVLAKKINEGKAKGSDLRAYSELVKKVLSLIPVR